MKFKFDWLNGRSFQWSIHWQFSFPSAAYEECRFCGVVRKDHDPQLHKFVEERRKVDRRKEK